MNEAENQINISKNLSALKNEINRDDIVIVAVSKTKPAHLILDAFRAGHRDFGENKVQELVQKYEELPKEIRWHMIGHLQRNKVKYIAPFVHLIHGVDSIKLLKEINKQAIKVNRTIQCLLQVHIASEETKFGFDPEELHELAGSGELTAFENIKVKGLMGMATFTEDQDQIRREFNGLSELYDHLKNGGSPGFQDFEYLSMGMSGDYRIALDEKSNMIRIGTAIFGARNNHG
jgi:hypothetical protein